MIGASTAIGFRHKRVSLSNPGASVPDADGGYTQEYAPLNPPQLFARVRPATSRDLERLVAGTMTTTPTHLVEMPYHPDVTQATRIMVEDYPRPDRTFEVMYVGNPEERDADLVLVCAEVLNAGTTELQDRDQRVDGTAGSPPPPPAGVND